VLHAQRLHAEFVLQIRHPMQGRIPLRERHPDLERQCLGIPPHATALEVLERRQVSVPRLQQTAAIARVPHRLERRIRVTAIDTREPDAIVGDVRRLRCRRIK